jgi:hypothetical protein
MFSGQFLPWGWLRPSVPNWPRTGEAVMSRHLALVGA